MTRPDTNSRKRRFEPSRTDAWRQKNLCTCPFCGQSPYITPWHGGKKTKRLIGCDSAWCDVQPSVTGETEKEAMQSWNRRQGD